MPSNHLRKLRLAVISPSNLGPYHLARYTYLCHQGVDLRIVRCPMNEHKRPWSFDSEKAPFQLDAPFSQTGPHGLVQPYSDAMRYLRKVSPDAVLIIGYGSRFLLAFATACRRLGITSILRLAHVLDIGSISPLREAAKQVVCRNLFDAVVVPGSRSARYARWVGFQPEDIWQIGNVVDNEHFDACSRTNPTGQHQFVYVGRLSEEKNLDGLLQAFSRYRGRGGTWRLNVVGDGPAADELERQSRGIAGVRFTGWAGYQEVSEHLSNATAFILPSLFEPWGLVVNEAMAAGLPVMVSRKCGCYPELCRDGGNGLSLDPTSSEKMSRAMEQMEAFSDQQRHAMGQLSKKIIDSFTLETWAASLLTCVASAVRAGRICRT